MVPQSCQCTKKSEGTELWARSKSGGCHKFYIFQAQRLKKGSWKHMETSQLKNGDGLRWLFWSVFWRIFVANSRKTQWLTSGCAPPFSQWFPFHSGCLDPPSTPNNGQSTEIVNIFWWLRLGHQNACLFWEHDDQLGIGVPTITPIGINQWHVHTFFHVNGGLQSWDGIA